MIELEKKLLSGVEINKFSIRSEIEDSHNENFEDDYSPVEDEVNNKFNQYIKLAELFGDDVFFYDRNSETIKLAPTFKAENEHLFCLYCMELKGSHADGDISDLFEKITAESLNALLGNDCQYVFCDKGKHGDFSVKELADIMGERFIRELKHDRNSQEGDGCCDIIFWKEIDNRAGKIVFLIQCKSGKKWQEGKGVEKRLWQDLIRFSTEPMIAYATTDLLQNNEKMNSQTLTKGLIFDRARIIRLLSSADNKQLETIRKKIEQLSLKGKIN